MMMIHFYRQEMAFFHDDGGVTYRHDLSTVYTLNIGISHWEFLDVPDGKHDETWLNSNRLNNTWSIMEWLRFFTNLLGMRFRCSSCSMAQVRSASNVHPMIFIRRTDESRFAVRGTFVFHDQRGV